MIIYKGKIKRGQKVYPLNKKDLTKIKKYLINNDKYVILGICTFGLYTGLRVSDYIDLEFEDIDNNFLNVYEKKTGKFNKIYLPPHCQNILETLTYFYKSKGIKNYNSGYIFKPLSYKFLKHQPNEHISYGGVAKYFSMMRKELNISYPIGTHSLRKTFATFLYAETNDVLLIQQFLNHSSPAITSNYIGIEEDRLKTLTDLLVNRLRF